MIVKLLNEHHLEFLSLKGDCRGSYVSTHLKCQIVGNLMPRLKFYEYQCPVCIGFPFIKIYFEIDSFNVSHSMASQLSSESFMKPPTQIAESAACRSSWHIVSPLKLELSVLLM